MFLYVKMAINVSSSPLLVCLSLMLLPSVNGKLAYMYTILHNAVIWECLRLYRALRVVISTAGILLPMLSVGWGRVWFMQRNFTYGEDKRLEEL